MCYKHIILIGYFLEAFKCVREMRMRFAVPI